MGDLPIHIYGYNNEHVVIVYTVVKDTQCQCGQPRQVSVYTETQPRSFQTKAGSAAFSKVSVFDLENTRVV